MSIECNNDNSKDDLDKNKWQQQIFWLDGGIFTMTGAE